MNPREKNEELMRKKSVTEDEKTFSADHVIEQEKRRQEGIQTATENLMKDLLGKDNETDNYQCKGCSSKGYDGFHWKTIEAKEYTESTILQYAAEPFFAEEKMRIVAVTCKICYRMFFINLGQIAEDFKPNQPIS